MGTVIVFTSGKGGTGKTSLTGGVGVALSKLGHKTLCIDGDVGLRNLDISLGMADAVLMDFMDVLEGNCSLEKAAVSHPSIPRLSLLTAPLHLEEGPPPMEAFRALLEEAKASYDYILMDSPAGLGAGFQLSVCGADRAVVVLLGDPSAQRDAQRVVTHLGHIPLVQLVVNRVTAKLFSRLGITVDEVMDFVGCPLLGLVPEDPQVLLTASGGSALGLYNHAGAALAFENIARRLVGERVPLLKL